MAELKTKPTEQSPDEFVAGIAHDKRRKDTETLMAMMRSVTGVEPVMWGKSIVGFGTYSYASKSGRKGEWMTIGFSPRAAALTLYGLIFYDEGRDQLAKLGDCTSGKGCINIKDLNKVNTDVLREMIQLAFTKKNGTTLEM